MNIALFLLGVAVAVIIMLFIFIVVVMLKLARKTSALEIVAQNTTHWIENVERNLLGECKLTLESAKAYTDSRIDKSLNK